MATLIFEVLRREGEDPFPCVVRTPEGRVLRLHGDAAPRHARWLGLWEGVAVWSEPAEATGTGTGQNIEIDAAELIDEVGVALGPERESGGLFDPPGESSLTGERTGASTEEAGVEQQRTALLAWIASSLGEPITLPEEGPPCAPLRARIADEPPDLLPSLGSPVVARDGRVTRPPPAAPPLPGPDRDDTVTHVDLLPVPALAPDASAPEATQPGATTTGSRVSRLLTTEGLLRVAPWVALGLLALSGFAWWAWAVPRG